MIADKGNLPDLALIIVLSFVNWEMRATDRLRTAANSGPENSILSVLFMVVAFGISGS